MSFEISEANYKTSMHWTNELVANACLITGSLKLILDLIRDEQLDGVLKIRAHGLLRAEELSKLL